MKVSLNTRSDFTISNGQSTFNEHAHFYL